VVDGDLFQVSGTQRCMATRTDDTNHGGPLECCNFIQSFADSNTVCEQHAAQKLISEGKIHGITRADRCLKAARHGSSDYVCTQNMGKGVDLQSSCKNWQSLKTIWMHASDIYSPSCLLHHWRSR
jgi:hypothetical protein